MAKQNMSYRSMCSIFHANQKLSRSSYRPKRFNFQHVTRQVVTIDESFCCSCPSHLITMGFTCSRWLGASPWSCMISILISEDKKLSYRWQTARRV